MFAEDEDNTLWTSGGGQVIGWLNTREYLETGDYEAAQGWTPFILDTNGNGVRDDFVAPNEAPDPTKDLADISRLWRVLRQPGPGRFRVGNDPWLSGGRGQDSPGQQSQ